MKLHNNFAVIYETHILENGNTVKQNPPKRNLLLDSGLDLVATQTPTKLFSRCVLGDGTTPTKRDSGAITVSITSGLATASAGYFEASDVGRLLKLDSGQEAYIIAFSSATEVSVDSSTDDSASEATIWYVNETGHSNELKRTSTTGSDTGDNTETWTGSTYEIKRTFIFSAETTNRTYREIGWSHTSTSGQNLFGRDLIPGGGDSIAIGQQYKVIVRLQITVGPFSITSISDVGSSGFDTSGDAMLLSIWEYFVRFNPSTGTKKISQISGDFTLPTTPSTSKSSGTNNLRLTKQTYTDGDFFLDWKYKFGTGSGNGDWYGVDFGGDTHGNQIVRYLRVKFATPQTKDSDHTLEFVFRQSWGRTLVN